MFSTTIAQITDTHIRSPEIPSFFDFDPVDFLKGAVAHMDSLPTKPDAVIITGDLADCGREDEYELYLDILKPLEMPVYVVPGNHDDRDNLRKVFRPTHGYMPEKGFLHYVVDDMPIRMIALDTTIDGEDGGMLCEERLNWLDARLNEAKDRPTLIFMHHPPLSTYMAEMDRLNCRNGNDLRALLKNHPQVVRVTCGHLHRTVQLRWEHAIVGVGPSTAHQLHLDFTPGMLTQYIMEPPGMLLHMWDEKQGLITHTMPIGDYAGPYDFHKARADDRHDV